MQTIARIVINKEKIVIAANPKGHFNNKFNRAAKLAASYQELEAKLYGIAERGIHSNTEHARAAIGCLLMMQTGIRVGNESSAEGYMTKPHPMQKDKKPEFVQTFGLTTLLPEHVDVKKGNVILDFTGKKQVQNTFTVKCKLIASWMKHLKQMEMGTLLGLTDYQMTKFVKKYVGKQYSPKDFRTMRANIIAGQFVNNEFKKVEKKKDFNAMMNNLYTHVSGALHNTKGVCKKNYVSDMLPQYLTERYFQQ